MARNQGGNRANSCLLLSFWHKISLYVYASSRNAPTEQATHPMMMLLTSMLQGLVGKIYGEAV
ncbi:MAG: hypothetical protein KBT06_06040 [Prevotellaceae bacterium]|nr:hypothetical protein [Candidatus Colivivens equi]